MDARLRELRRAAMRGGPEERAAYLLGLARAGEELALEGAAIQLVETWHSYALGRDGDGEASIGNWWAVGPGPVLRPMSDQGRRIRAEAQWERFDTWEALAAFAAPQVRALTWPGPDEDPGSTMGQRLELWPLLDEF